MPFVDTTPEFWDKILAINLKGPIACTHAALPAMIDAGVRQDRDFIASDAGRVGSTGEAVYSAAKGGLIALTKTLAREMARHRINVNCVCPGPSDTPLFRNEFAADQPQARREPQARHPVGPPRRARTTSRPPSSSSPPTTRASSPARRCPSPAASRWCERRRRERRSCVVGACVPDLRRSAAYVSVRDSRPPRICAVLVAPANGRDRKRVMDHECAGLRRRWTRDPRSFWGRRCGRAGRRRMRR